MQKYNFFFNWQENFEVFFWKFLSPFYYRFLISLSRNFARFAGCKCNKLFLISQAFLNLFLKINYLSQSSLLVSLLKNVCVIAGAKVAPLFAFTSFFKPFFSCFYNPIFNSLKTWFLNSKVFYTIQKKNQKTHQILLLSRLYNIYVPIIFIHFFN